MLGPFVLWQPEHETSGVDASPAVADVQARGGSRVRSLGEHATFERADDDAAIILCDFMEPISMAAVLIKLVA